jgi:general secretion pathway protein E
LTTSVRGIDALGPPDLRQARGCAECEGVGFAGRSTIAEILLIDSELHRLLLSNASDAEIARVAHEQGMVSMHEMGIAKAWRGETTVEEVLRATRMG